MEGLTPLVAKSRKSAHPSSMREITGPSVKNDHPDRHNQCLDSIQFAFQDLVEKAIAAGWTEREAVDAINTLADDHMLAMTANDDSYTLMEVLKRMSSR